MEAFHPGDHLVIQVLDPSLEQGLADLVRQAFTDAFPAVSTTVFGAFTEGQPSVSIIAVYRDCAPPGSRARGLMAPHVSG